MPHEHDKPFGGLEVIDLSRAVARQSARRVNPLSPASERLTGSSVIGSPRGSMGVKPAIWRHASALRTLCGSLVAAPVLTNRAGKAATAHPATHSDFRTGRLGRLEESLEE